MLPNTISVPTRVVQTVAEGTTEAPKEAETETLSTAAQKIGEKLYKAAQEAQAQPRRKGVRYIFYK